MDHKIKQIIINAIQTTPGVLGIAQIDYTDKNFVQVSEDKWENAILLTQNDDVFSAKVAILIQDNTQTKNVIREITSFVMHKAKVEKIKMSEIVIFVRGVIYE